MEKVCEKMGQETKILGMLRAEDYPEDQRKLVEDFNSKLLLISEENSRLTYTISRKEQLRQTRINGAIRIYNINVTLNEIEDEIFEYIDGEALPVFERMGLPCPCPLELFVERVIEVRKLDKMTAERFAQHFNRDNLLYAYQSGAYEQVLNYELIMDDGKTHLIHHTIFMTVEPNHNHIIAMCSAKDITEQAETNKALTEAKDTINQELSVIEGLTKGFYCIFLINPWDCSMKLFRFTGSEDMTELLKLSQSSEFYDAVMNEYLDDYVEKSERSRLRKQVSFDSVAKKLEKQEMFTVNYRRRGENGDLRWHQMTFARHQDELGYINYVLAFSDVDESMRLESENAENKLLLKQYEHDMESKDRENDELMHILTSMAGMYFSMHLIELQEDTIKEICLDELARNLADTDLGAQGMLDLVVGRCALPEYYDSAMEFTRLDTLPNRLKDKKSISFDFQGIVVGWVRFRFVAIDYEDGKLRRVAFLALVVDAEKREEERLIRWSTTDELTGARNRRMYEETLDYYRNADEECEYHIFALDVNRLKYVNDTLGHVAGDELIVGTATGLINCFGNVDRVFRIGGDEFACILEMSTKDFEHCIRKFERYVSEWSGKYTNELAVSYGYVGSLDEPRLGTDDMVREADRRMYNAKREYYKVNGIDRRK